MKKLLLIIALLLSVATLSAQSGLSVQPKHSVEISGYPFSPTVVEASASSGLLIDNSLYIGIGTGIGMMGTCTVNAPDASTKHISISGGAFIPLFADMKWQVLSSEYSPFLQTRVGYECSLKYKEIGKYFNAAIGMNIRRLSVSICYTLHRIMPTLNDIPDTNNINEPFLLRFNYPSLRIGWEF